MKETSNIFSTHHLNQLEKLGDDKSLRENAWFVTLRHRKWRNVVHQSDQFGFGLKYKEHITDTLIPANWNYFRNILNSCLYGNNAKKHGKYFQHITVQHMPIDNRFLSHIHSIIWKPAHITVDVFRKLILHSWSKTHWGAVGKKKQMFNIQKVYSSGVIRYGFRDEPYFDSLPLL